MGKPVRLPNRLHFQGMAFSPWVKDCFLLEHVFKTAEDLMCSQDFIAVLTYLLLAG